MEQNYCNTHFGTNLASIHSNDDFDDINYVWQNDVFTIGAFSTQLATWIGYILKVAIWHYKRIMTTLVAVPKMLVNFLRKLII